MAPQAAEYSHYRPLFLDDSSANAELLIGILHEGLGEYPCSKIYTYSHVSIPQVLTWDPLGINSCVGTNDPQVLNLTLFEIKVFDRVFKLSSPVGINVKLVDDSWCFESVELGIVAFGSSHKEAITSFQEDFSVLWDTIANLPDDHLTADALAVKRSFHRIVSMVQ